MARKRREIGAIPGYSGHIPCMRNHLIGQTFTPATIRSATCADYLLHNDYASALPLTLESRPQGRDFLYAQTAKLHDRITERQPIIPRVSKRLPPLEMHHAAGIFDSRQMKVVVGTADGFLPEAFKTTSLPDLPYTNRMLQVHKNFDSIEQEAPTIKSIPGYTGHQHGVQHIFSRSYGSMERELLKNNQSPDKSTATKLLYYDDPRPTGKILVEKHRIPGYQGYIPSKNIHIYGKTAGLASDLAAAVQKCLKDRRNPNTELEFVDNPPQGHVDLYAQSQERYHMDEIVPLDIRVDKGRVHIDFLERRSDYKMKERIQPDIREVMQSKHHLHGYTGHVHALQHTYGRSYGKITRSLHEKPANPATSEENLEFGDNRPLIHHNGEELLLP